MLTEPIPLFFFPQVSRNGMWCSGVQPAATCAVSKPSVHTWRARNALNLLFSLLSLHRPQKATSTTNCTLHQQQVQSVRKPQAQLPPAPAPALRCPRVLLLPSPRPPNDASMVSQRLERSRLPQALISSSYQHNEAQLVPSMPANCSLALLLTAMQPSSQRLWLRVTLHVGNEKQSIETMHGNNHPLASSGPIACPPHATVRVVYCQRCQPLGIGLRLSVTFSGLSTIRCAMAPYATGTVTLSALDTPAIATAITFWGLIASSCLTSPTGLHWSEKATKPHSSHGYVLSDRVCMCTAVVIRSNGRARRTAERWRHSLAQREKGREATNKRRRRKERTEMFRTQALLELGHMK